MANNFSIFYFFYKFKFWPIDGVAHCISRWTWIAWFSFSWWYYFYCEYKYLFWVQEWLKIIQYRLKPPTIHPIIVEHTNICIRDQVISLWSANPYCEQKVASFTSHLLTTFIYLCCQNMLSYGVNRCYCRCIDNDCWQILIKCF